MSIYVFLNVKKLIFNLEDKNSTEHGLLNLKSHGTVKMEDTGIFAYFVISKQLNNPTQVLASDYEEYLDLSYRQVKTNMDLSVD